MKQQCITKKLPMYRCYTDESEKSKHNSVVGSSLFDLIGKKEPDQTKSLGYVLARSEYAMEQFLDLICKKNIISVSENEVNINIKDLMKDEYLIDCELMLQSDNGTRDRADIVIRFPKSQFAIIVEAKSASSNTSSKLAYFQGQSYADRLHIKQKVVISLTNNKELGNCVQWSEIIDMFDGIVNKYPDYKVSLENDFLNYILTINGLMKYYDIEVLSIPAGITIEGVYEAGIYECPAERPPYKSRGEHKPLFMAFRGKGGSVKKLYKVAQLLKMPIAGSSYETQKESIDSEIIESIEKYKSILNFQVDEEEVKWVFVLDKDKSIDLPNEVRYKANNSFVETSRPLKDYFKTPNKDGIVEF